MPIILKTIFCFFLFVSISQPLYAEEEPEKQIEAQQVKPEKKKQYYIVEVILFKHLNEQGKQDEFWHRPEMVNDNSITELTYNPIESVKESNDSLALAEYDMQNRHFTPLRNNIAALASANYKLSDAAAHLRYSKDFKLLAHFGWTQLALSKREALPVRLTSKQFSDSLIPDGDLELYVSRYLHLQLDLKASECVYIKEPSLAMTADDKALDEQLQNGSSQLEAQRITEVTANNMTLNESVDSNQCVNKVYQFKQNRKMRSRELHYIDNPVFGLLVYVTPYSTSSSNKE